MVVRRMVTMPISYALRQMLVLNLTYSASRTIYENFPEDVRLAFPASEESAHTDLAGLIVSRFRLEIALVYNTDAGAITELIFGMHKCWMIERPWWPHLVLICLIESIIIGGRHSTLPYDRSLPGWEEEKFLKWHGCFFPILKKRCGDTSH